MGVNGGVTCCSCQLLAFFVRNVFPTSLNISFSKVEALKEDLLCSLIMTDAEVIWFDVPVEKLSTVDVLHMGNHLINEHENSLEGELSVGLIEQILKSRAH